MIDRIETRPEEPENGDVVWYRGWECGWDEEADKWTREPWRAYERGVDLDAPQVSGRTWEDLLCEIDAEEDDDLGGQSNDRH